MKSLIKSTVSSSSIGMWILGALFVMHVCATVQTTSAIASGGEIVLASAE